VVVCYDALEWFPTPVVGFSDCLSTEGESWSAKEVSSHSLLKSSITANLASVKRSLLDHTSHCHPFLVDSSLLINVLWPVCVMALLRSGQVIFDLWKIELGVRQVIVGHHMQAWVLSTSNVSLQILEHFELRQRYTLPPLVRAYHWVNVHALRYSMST
jgi:hypothetical protein